MANPYVATIGATDKTLDIKAKTLRFSEHVQNRGQITFSLIGEDASYIPSRGDEFTVTKDAATICRGLIERARLQGLNGSTGAAVEIAVTAIDLRGYFLRRVVYLEIAAGTLKAAITALEPYWGDALGFTLDAAQVDGPSLPALVYDGQTLLEVFEDLANRTVATGSSYQLQVDFDKEFRFIAVGSVASPFNIGPGLDPNLDGDLSKELSAIQRYNRVIVRVGSEGQRNVSKTFTGDGATDTFQLDYAINGPQSGSPNVGNGWVRVNGVLERLGALGTGYAWEYNPSTLEITRTLGAPGLGIAIILAYQVRFPVRVTSEVPGLDEEDYVEKVIPAPDLYSLAEAQAFADRALHAFSIEPETVRYPTTTAGLRPGMSQAIERPDRAVDDDFVITQLDAQDLGGACLAWSVTAVAGDIVPKPWQAMLKDAISTTGGGTRPTAGDTFNGSDLFNSNGGSNGPAPEDTWVQTNVRNSFGAFPGLRWLYEQVANIVLGFPPAPAVADEGSGSYAAVERKYRIQSGVLSGSVVVAQSELGPETTITPSGSGVSLRVTQPTLAGSPTHWRVFGSDDGSAYVDISGWIVVATTTYDDSADPTAYTGPSPAGGGEAGALSSMAQLLLTALSDSPAESLLKIRNPNDTGVMSFIPWGAGYQEFYIGAEVVNGQYIARSSAVALLWASSSGDGSCGITLYVGETPGSPMTFAEHLDILLTGATSPSAGRDGYLDGNASPNVWHAHTISLRGNAGDKTDGEVNIVISDTVTGTKGLAIQLGNTNRTIRFDGVGSAVTFT